MIKEYKLLNTAVTTQYENLACVQNIND